MDAELHRIEALPASGGYALTFRAGDGTEHTAVVQVAGQELHVADASLPTGWSRDGDAFAATAAAVRAMDDARSARPAAGSLRDVPGGWDVALGNVTVDDAGVRCTAHGLLERDADVHRCPVCGAQALVA